MFATPSLLRFAAEAPRVGCKPCRSALLCCLALWSVMLSCSSPTLDIEAPAIEAAAHPWITIFDGATLDGWESISYGGEGEVELLEGHALLERGVALTGMRYVAGLSQTIDYELELSAARVMGNDFFCGLSFPIGEQFATLILGGWGGGLCGLSCIDGQDASDNSTKTIRGFELDHAYSVTLRVEAQRVRAWVDEELLFDVATQGKDFSLRTEILPSPPLSVSSFITTARIGPIRWRPLLAEPSR